MKSSDLIEALERFFNDVIGTVIPGFLFLFSLWYIFESDIIIRSILLFPPNSSLGWYLTILFSYVVGHFVISLGNLFVFKIIDSIIGFMQNHNFLRWLIPKQCITNRELMNNISCSNSFKDFLRLYYNIIDSKIPLNINKSFIHEMRSNAMTIASNDTHVVYRFMFISLLNLGIATVLISSTLIKVIILLYGKYIKYSPASNIKLWHLLIFIIVALFFIERRYAFYGRSMRVPFSMALAKLRDEYSKIYTVEGKALESRGGSKGIINIYLAGGFRTDWQDKLISKFKNINFLDPRMHKLEKAKEYTLWDLEAIRISDCVFAYFEAGNPGGYALASEIGYAKAMGKIIILVDEKSKTDENIKRHLKMLHGLADVEFDDISKGIEYLEKYTSIFNSNKKVD